MLEPTKRSVAKGHLTTVYFTSQLGLVCPLVLFASATASGQTRVCTYVLKVPTYSNKEVFRYWCTTQHATLVHAKR
jgi:hypothetical protein